MNSKTLIFRGFLLNRNCRQSLVRAGLLSLEEHMNIENSLSDISDYDTINKIKIQGKNIQKQPTYRIELPFLQYNGFQHCGSSLVHTTLPISRSEPEEVSTKVKER